MDDMEQNFVCMLNCFNVCCDGCDPALMAQ